VNPASLDYPVGVIWWIECGFADRAAELGRPVPEAPVVAKMPATALFHGERELRLPLGAAPFAHELHLVCAVAPDLKMAPGLVFTANNRPAFAAVGAFASLRHETGSILSVNGAARQRTDPAAMLWGVERLIDYLLRKHGLAAGDLVFTGTPAGVRTVAPGDLLAAVLDDGSSLLRVRAD
jgi:2-keto-4-pentenoate hydratase/2-oxohepta-3-ene-1,7-dioic acid hydratase in catechol pathway